MSIAGLNASTPSSASNAGLGDNEIRALKTAIKACFGGVAGPVNAGTGNPLATDVELTELFDRLDVLETKITQGIAVGEIRLWYGTAASIPVGWTICNGAGGTPALNGKFPLGADVTSGMPTYGGGATGGAIASGSTGPATAISMTVDPHPLTIAELPAGLPGALLVQHDTGSDGIQHSNSGSAAGGETIGTAKSIVTGTGFNGAGHSHTLSGSFAHTHSMSISGGLPPWACVYFIMYTG